MSQNTLRWADYAFGQDSSCFVLFLASAINLCCNRSLHCFNGLCLPEPVSTFQRQFFLFACAYRTDKET